MARSTRQKVGAEQGGIRLDGLDETIAALKKLENGAEKGVRVANKEAATKVATGATSAAISLGGVAAHVAPSIKASAGIKSGSVSFGGDDYPMGAGAEFGGGRRKTTRQFKPWRGSGGNAGYFVYPTIRRESADIRETYEQAMERIMREAGLL